MSRTLLKALAPSREGDRRPGVREMTVDQILEWALDPYSGGLPKVSAEPFTRWIAQARYDYVDEADEGDAAQTNGQILESAREHWCGQS